MFLLVRQHTAYLRKNRLRLLHQGIALLLRHFPAVQKLLYFLLRVSLKLFLESNDLLNNRVCCILVSAECLE